MYKFFGRFLRLNPSGLLQKKEFTNNPIKPLYDFKNDVRITCNKFSTNLLPEQNNSLTDEQISSLTKGDPQLLQKLNILMLEVQVLHQDGDKVPDYNSITFEQWEHLLSLRSRSARKKYMIYLWKNERTKENDKARKEEARKAREEFIALRNKETNTDDEYRLFGNTIFLRLYDTTVNQFLNNRLIQAMKFGQPLVLDCSYTEHMNRRECFNAAKQLMLLFSANRAHHNPFDLHFCNVNREDITTKQLQKFIVTMDEPWFPLNIHEDSYLNHFPKEKLVYLTPHCRNDLEEFNHDDIYIIGAMVDMTNTDPLSLAKAKQQGLRMARFPIDKHIAWSKSTKSLTLNQVCSILLDIRETGDWSNAFKHIPTRKIMSEEELSQYSVKKRYEKRSPFLLDSTSGNRNSFREGFKNLEAHQTFINDLQVNNRRFNNQNFNNKYKANINRNSRVNLRDILKEE